MCFMSSVSLIYLIYFLIVFSVNSWSTIVVLNVLYINWTGLSVYAACAHPMS